MALWKATVTVQRTKDEHLIVTVEADTEEEAKDAAMDEDQWLDVEHEETEPQEGGPVSLRRIELEDDDDDEEEDCRRHRRRVHHHEKEAEQHRPEQAPSVPW